VNIFATHENHVNVTSLSTKRWIMLA